MKRFATLRRVLLVACVLGGGLAVPVASAAASEVAPPAFRSADGLSVDAVVANGERDWRITVSTADLAQPVHVNVLLPTGYDPADRYPTLYLFHGTSGTADDWLDYGNVRAATAGRPMIVVMPDAGYNGNGGSWFTNWVDQHTKLGTANWESFHIDQLVPWIDDNLPTIRARDGRAIAGVSQGGFGSFTYAARHPDLFTSAGSFSGAPDIDSNLLVKTGATAIIDATASGLDGVEPNAFFGDPILDDINWQGHNPATLVTNLRDTDLRLWTGNGVLGPLDTDPAVGLGAAPVEAIVHVSALSFAAVARKAGVAYTLDDYGPGTHSWPYWARDLVQYLPDLMQTFDHPSTAPTSISYRSIDRTWAQWGWTVATHRTAAQAFSGLTDASTGGFTLTGGNATVTTPAAFTPGSQHTISVHGAHGPSSAIADAYGRLSVTVTAAGASPVTVSIRA